MCEYLELLTLPEQPSSMLEETECPLLIRYTMTRLSDWRIESDSLPGRGVWQYADIPLWHDRIDHRQIHRLWINHVIHTFVDN